MLTINPINHPIEPGICELLITCQLGKMIGRIAKAVADVFVVIAVSIYNAGKAIYQCCCLSKCCKKEEEAPPEENVNDDRPDPIVPEQPITPEAARDLDRLFPPPAILIPRTVDPIVPALTDSEEPVIPTVPFETQVQALFNGTDSTDDLAAIVDHVSDEKKGVYREVIERRRALEATQNLPREATRVESIAIPVLRKDPVAVKPSPFALPSVPPPAYEAPPTLTRQPSLEPAPAYEPPSYVDSLPSSRFKDPESALARMAEFRAHFMTYGTPVTNTIKAFFPEGINIQFNVDEFLNRYNKRQPQSDIDDFFGATGNYLQLTDQWGATVYEYLSIAIDMIKKEHASGRRVASEMLSRRGTDGEIGLIWYLFNFILQHCDNDPEIRQDTETLANILATRHLLERITWLHDRNPKIRFAVMAKLGAECGLKGNLFTAQPTDHEIEAHCSRVRELYRPTRYFTERYNDFYDPLYNNIARNITQFYGITRPHPLIEKLKHPLKFEGALFMLEFAGIIVPPSTGTETLPTDDLPAYEDSVPEIGEQPALPAISPPQGQRETAHVASVSRYLGEDSDDSGVTYHLDNGIRLSFKWYEDPLIHQGDPISFTKNNGQIQIYYGNQKTSTLDGSGTYFSA